MTKKLNSLEELAKIQFENLAPDPDPLPDPKPNFKVQELEAHFSNRGRAGKTVTIIKGFKGSAEELKTLAKELKREVPFEEVKDKIEAHLAKLFEANLNKMGV